jgi:hypothetical protein
LEITGRSIAPNSIISLFISLLQNQAFGCWIGQSADLFPGFEKILPRSYGQLARKLSHPVLGRSQRSSGGSLLGANIDGKASGASGQSKAKELGAPPEWVAQIIDALTLGMIRTRLSRRKPLFCHQFANASLHLYRLATVCGFASGCSATGEWPTRGPHLAYGHVWQVGVLPFALHAREKVLSGNNVLLHEVLLTTPKNACTAGDGRNARRRQRRFSQNQAARQSSESRALYRNAT